MTGASGVRPDPEGVRSAAISSLLSLPEARGEALASLWQFAAVPEETMEVLPWLFLPPGVSADPAGITELAVAGKLSYARVRWLDHLADQNSEGADPVRLSGLHRLNLALERLVLSKYVSVLEGPRLGGFLLTLSELHSRYSASLAADGGGFVAGIELGDYVEHAKARAAPVRGAVDAASVLAGLSEEPELARRCFESYVVGLQLYDDAVDVEEDFRDGRVSWVVSETLRASDGGRPPEGSDEFYEQALLSGALDRCLKAASRQFGEALTVARSRFTRFAGHLEGWIEETDGLMDDLREIVEASR